MAPVSRGSAGLTDAASNSGAVAAPWPKAAKAAQTIRPVESNAFVMIWISIVLNAITPFREDSYI